MREGLCIIKKATISGLFIRRGSKHSEIKAASQHFIAFFHEDMLQCTAKANACFDTLWLHLITQQFSSVCAFIRCSCRCRKCRQISVKKQACWPPWKVTRMHWVDISGPWTAAAAHSSWVKRTVQDLGELQYTCGVGRRQFRTRDSYRAHGAFEDRHAMNPAGGQRLSAATCPQHQVLCSLAVLISEVAPRHTGLTKVLGPLKLHLFNWRPEGPIQYFNNLVFNCENYNRAR